MIVSGAFGRSVDTVDALGSASLALRKLTTTAGFQSMTACTRKSYTTALPVRFLRTTRSLKGAVEVESFTMSTSGAISLTAYFASTALSTGVD